MILSVRSLLFNFVSNPKAKPWLSISLEEELVLSPIFVTLIDPSDHEDQLSGNKDLSFLARRSFDNEVKIALPKSNLIFWLDWLDLFCLILLNLFETEFIEFEIEFFAEIDLLCGLSACPGGDCSSSHSSDKAICYPLKVEIYKPLKGTLKQWSAPSPNKYSRNHGHS